MNIATLLARSVNQLEQRGIATARLDILVLFEDELALDRSRILAHPELELLPVQVKALQRRIERRARHEPLAYIRGKTEFYGREFAVNHHVLEPRPESEAIIDLLRALHLPDDDVCVDIGTGSGALAITAKLACPSLNVIATDIDSHCLEVANRNATTLQADIKLLQGDLLDPIISTGLVPTVLLCNLPYVPNGFHINPAAMREPRRAIFGGEDGLELYRRLFTQLAEAALKPRFILAETLPPQHDELQSIAHGAGYAVSQTDDFVQLFRKEFA